ncbi:hypothetical protein BS50DRAFT_111890 [Corynespora cassiicola Philippines]|uniref:Uncharacterized protein n=1 Tax=Corynespora cassiicola Philippines TaxID=1448308 RepID=A0A2T2NDA3_CORCC|nr:hypothetical protein BS50DRAFT_111890 [Corynespora cassiicola Philippines]
MLATSRRPSPRCYRYIHLGVLVVMPSAPSAPSAPSPQSSAVQRAQCLRSATYGGPAHSPRTSIFPAIRRRGGDALFSFLPHPAGQAQRVVSCTAACESSFPRPSVARCLFDPPPVPREGPAFLQPPPGLRAWDLFAFAYLASF